jgi:hypothetical protein
MIIYQFSNGLRNILLIKLIKCDFSPCLMLMLLVINAGEGCFESKVLVEEMY